MDVLFVAPEIAPYSAWTHAAEFAAALPKALRGLGHKVTVLSPLWASIDPAARHLARRLVKFEVDIDGARHTLALYDGRSPGGVELQFLAESSLFPASAAAPEEGPATAARWGAFARGAVEFVLRAELLPDVVHLIGWQTAILPVLFREHPTLAGIPTVLTIPDVRALGLYDRSAMASFGVPERWWRIDGVEFYGKLSTLKAGVQTASRLTTPSPTYSREILDDAGGLEGAFRARRSSLVGILDGVDVSVWNAATDPWLESRYDAMDVAGAGRYGKHRCKGALQRELGLPARDDVPLLAAIGVASAAQGFDLLADVAPAALRNDVQIAIAAEPGSDPALVRRFVELAARWPDRLAVRADADVGFVHRTLGASDALIVPARHEPGAARAMQAHRYGALPIARRAGGVADAVVDCDARLVSGTGFLYDEPTAPSMLGAIQRAIAGYAERGAYRALQHRAMTVDHSWDRSARLYERLYRSVCDASAREAGSTASEART
jgi:starch synthase